MREADTLLPVSLLDAETQAIIIAGLCSVGAWVIFKWIIQLIFSVLWPLFAIIGVMIIMPSFRKTLTYDILPKQIRVMKCITKRLLESFNIMYKPN
ncbi:hypothetical protein FQR65_LT00312 [Abscondita terminalis]|nr:hypothetical protein FQR65_LT00312 [Abscondita terminalis]